MGGCVQLRLQHTWWRARRRPERPRIAACSVIAAVTRFELDARARSARTCGRDSGSTRTPAHTRAHTHSFGGDHSSIHGVTAVRRRVTMGKCSAH
jgi:hypothetical protein